MDITAVTNALSGLCIHTHSADTAQKTLVYQAQQVAFPVGFIYSASEPEGK